MMVSTLFRNARRFFSLLVGIFLLAGCGGGGSGDGGEPEIVVVERSPAIENVTTDIVSPENGAVLESAPVTATVTAENFDTGKQTDTGRADSVANSENGQHFHLILDNEPYMANYTAGEPFEIGELEPGVHTLVAFPGRSYHESVKGAGAYAFPGAYKTYDFIHFYVKEKTGDPMLNTEDPAIIYSRPKGTYSGDAADRILLDFYLHNVELSSEGYKAKYTIRDKNGDRVTSRAFTEWTPGYLTGLSPGTYTVNLKLLDGDGKAVSGPFNDTTREIVVEK